MKQLVIIGAGGMGRTLYDSARESVGYGIDYEIKGFIDDNIHSLDGFHNYPPMLGTIAEYVPQKNDVFVSSIGGGARKKCIESVVCKGGQFITLIHSTARIGSNVQIGEGTTIGAFTTIGADAKVGKYNMIQSYSVIGHDSQIGNYNRIDTHVTLVGGTIVEDEADIHTGAMISHNVVIETHSRVAACSFVIRKVKSGTTVMGNPAKKLM
ncbi:MAG: sialic acid O-acetyltransferase [Paludibacteraceae bacterium]|nr:sialic acid O-acetyltransferase [Paludibacteraceae bacterium]